MYISNLDNKKCRIIVDAMGGDYAPENIVIGAIDAFNTDKSFELYFVGREEEIRKVINEKHLNFDFSHIINASQVIEMADIPTESIKTKKDSSIVVGIKFVKEGKADAFVSAGNTGAVMAASTLIIGRIPNVGRPTIGALIPNQNGVCFLFDVGASVDSKPKHLLEYAIMGTIFTKEIYGVKNPRVGILSVGEEDSKGNDVTLAASKLIKKTNLNFIGNVEGRDLLKGTANVVVCDGFVGNILIKFGETIPSFLKSKLMEFAQKSFFNKLKLLFVRNTLKNVLKDFDYQEQGGVPLLGINGISIIGHGSSTPKAIMNMVLRANEMYKKNLVTKIEAAIKQYSNPSILNESSTDNQS